MNQMTFSDMEYSGRKRVTQKEKFLREMNDIIKELYLKQKRMLEQFLERGAISRAQYDKSLRDMKEKMGISEQETPDGTKEI
jgi:hypothetical protein